MSDQSRNFAVCIRNDGYEESLELRKIYEVCEDPTAEQHGMIRVIDEEGEEYLYPINWFVRIELPERLERAVVEITHRSPAV